MEYFESIGSKMWDLFTNKSMLETNNKIQGKGFPMEHLIDKVWGVLDLHKNGLNKFSI